MTLGIKTKMPSSCPSDSQSTETGRGAQSSIKKKNTQCDEGKGRIKKPDCKF